MRLDQSLGVGINGIQQDDMRLLILRIVVARPELAPLLVPGVRQALAAGPMDLFSLERPAHGRAGAWVSLDFRAKKKTEKVGDHGTEARRRSVLAAAGAWVSFIFEKEKEGTRRALLLVDVGDRAAADGLDRHMVNATRADPVLHHEHLLVGPEGPTLLVAAGKAPSTNRALVVPPGGDTARVRRPALLVAVAGADDAERPHAHLS